MKKIEQFQGKYFFLSNFSYFSCEIEETIYPTVEHAFQACKTENKKLKLKIKSAMYPAQAKKYGRTVPLRSDWEKIKIKIMEQCLQSKYERNPEAKELLLATGDAILEEGNYWRDSFWGVCNGIGENHLGKLHMKIRKEFKNEGIN